MYLHGACVLLIMVIHICIATQDKTYSVLQDKTYGLRDISLADAEDSPKHRQKRVATIIEAAVLVGMRAVRFILQQATRVPSASPTRQFVKSGGYERAIDDFLAAHPINVHSFELPEGTYVIAGRTGDRQLILKHSGGASEPTLEVMQWKRSSNYPYRDLTTSKITDEITYVD